MERVVSTALTLGQTVEIMPILSDKSTRAYTISKHFENYSAVEENPCADSGFWSGLGRRL